MNSLHKKHKLDVIAHTLTSCGIPIWHGIPEKIVDDLKAHGYKIKKCKKRIPLAKAHYSFDDFS